MKIKTQVELPKGDFTAKCMQMVFKGHVQEFKEWYSYPKAGGGAFGPRTDKNPI